MYYPVIIMVIGYDIFVKERRDKIRIIYGIINLILVSASFMYFQFGAYINYTDTDSFILALSEHSDFVTLQSGVKIIIEGELCTPRNEIYKVINMSFFTNEYPREKLLLTIFLVIPVVSLFAGIYKKCYEYCRIKGKRVFCSRYTLFLLLHLCILPQFVLNVDWGRWMIADTFVAFFSVLFLYFVHDEGMSYSLDCLAGFILRNKWFAVFTLIYFAFMNPFLARDFIPEVNIIFSFISKLLK